MDLEHIDRRLDRIEEKLDNHMERVTRNEVSIDSIRGQVKWAGSVLLALITAGLTALVHLLTGGK